MKQTNILENDTVIREGRQSPQIRRLFNLKNLKEIELAKRKKKQGPVNDYPTRKQFYEHLNKARYDR